MRAFVFAMVGVVSLGAVAGVVPGRIPGDFEVSSFGGSSYRIPIEVAAGINGLKPAISLAYSSSAGDGLVGMGWQLGGFSAISRCPTTISQDGTMMKGVGYTAADKLCLDGLRLVSTAAGVFRTELDGYDRISASGSTGTGFASFTVQRPNGLKYSYGTTADSQILAPGTTAVRYWALSTIEDKYANKIIFHYNQDAQAGEYWPTDIRWTVKSGQAEANARYKLAFSYGTSRPDPRSGYEFGSPWARTRRLESIVYSADGGAGLATVHTYTLSYKSGVQRSQLASVKLNGPTDELAPTTFTWRSDAIGFGSETAGPTTADYNLASYGDIDNDGDTDVFMGHNVMLAEPVAGVCCTYTASQPINATGTRVLMDVNGDGRVEPPGWLNNGGLMNFTPVPSYAPLLEISAGPLPVDIDGDGRDDLVAIGRNAVPGPSYVYIWRNEDGVLQPPVQAFSAAQQAGLTSAWQSQPADFDGDGRQDLLIREDASRWHAFRSDTLAVAGYSPPTFTDYGGNGGLAEIALTADVNGDGLTDVVLLGGTVVQPLGISIAISKGKHDAGANSIFADLVTTEIAPGAPWMTRVVDYDGDGRDDILTVNLGGCHSPASGWCVWKSNGSNYLASNVEYVSGLDPGGIGTANPPQVASVDINADGYRDLLVASINGGAWKYRLHAGPRANLVTAITDGLGNDHSVSYTALSQVANDGVADPPVTRLVRDARPVVAAYTAEDGAGGTFTRSLTYSGALRDAHGRGFLGFKKITMDDSRTNTPDSEVEYRQDFPYIGRVAKESLLRPGSNLPVRVTTNTWTRHVTDPDSNALTANANAVYAERAVTREYEVDPTGTANNSLFRTTDRHVVTWSTTHNAPESTTVAVTSPQQPGSDYSTTVSMIFDGGPASTTVWCLGLPLQVDTTRANSSNSEGRRTTMTWDQATCDQLTETTGATGPASEQLKTTTAYDSYGRLSTVTQDNGAGSLAAVSQNRKVQYTYDHNGEDARPYQETRFVAGEDPYVSYSVWNAGLGLPVGAVDVRLQPSGWSYDNFGRIKAETLPSGIVTTYAYANCSIPDSGCFASQSKYRVIASENSGFWSQTDFDQLGRPVGAATVLGDNRVSRSQTRFNSLGQAVEQTVPAIGTAPAATIVSTFDLLGRLQTETRPTETGTSTTIFIRSGLTVAERDGNNHTTTRTFNPDGTLNLVVDAIGKTTNYTHTAFGELAQILDSGGNATVMTYDARGFQRTVDDPDSVGIWYTDYTAFGEVWRVRTPKTNAPDWTLVMAYDQLGRPVQRNEAEGQTNWTYYETNTSTDNAKGLLETVTGPIDSTPGAYQEHHWYNGMGLERLTEVTIEGAPYETQIGYDSLGRLASMRYPAAAASGRNLYVWSYTNGYTSQVSQNALPIWTLVAADALGEPEHQRYGTGGTAIDERRTRNASSLRLTDIETGPAMGSAIQNYRYQWDNAGNLSVRRNLAAGGAIEAFNYDSLNRLDYVWLNGVQTLDLDYDDATGNTGNIKYKSDFGTYTYGYWGAGPRQVSQVTGADSQTYHYDVNGNMDCRGWSVPNQACVPTATADQYQWTSFNMPKRLERGAEFVALSYGPDRQRVKEIAGASGTTRTTYLPGPHFEKNVGSNYTRFRQNVFVDGRVVYFEVGDEIVGDGHMGTTFQYYAYNVHRDHQGSWDQITPAWGSGAQIGYSFDAFGKRRWGDWSADPIDFQLTIDHMAKRGYTGHEHLDGVALIHMNGRVQDPVLGRMISRDPLPPDIQDPRTLNPFAYVANNPLTLSDPTGYCFSDDLSRCFGGGDFSGYCSARGCTRAPLGVSPVSFPSTASARLTRAEFALSADAADDLSGFGQIFSNGVQSRSSTKWVKGPGSVGNGDEIVVEGHWEKTLELVLDWSARATSAAYWGDTSHYYINYHQICGSQAGCTSQNVFQNGLLHRPTPGSRLDSPVRNGQRVRAAGFGDVKVSVDARRLSIRNTTLPGHLLFPGSVQRSVVRFGYGVAIRSIGQGTGAGILFSPTVQEIGGPALWNVVDAAISSDLFP